ncbi:MAG: hypothetical protein ACXADD_18590 [Candidatus Thorarchaeota archaeon]|jgi:hypothetical protein
MSEASLLQCGYLQSTLAYPNTSLRLGHKREWAPFSSVPIRLFGNNKSTRTPEGKSYGRRNITSIGFFLDTVRGCPFAAVYSGHGCYGHCYLAESMARYHMKYWIPVSNQLNKKLLAMDLERLNSDIVRNGVNGEPSYDFPLTTTCAEFSDLYDKTTVLLTRFGIEPDLLILQRLARVGTIIHGSVSALDPTHHQDRVLRNLERYEAVGGRVVVRVITGVFKPDESGLWEKQDELMVHDKAFQQPLRILGDSPVNKHLDLTTYGPTISNTDGKVSNRWRSADDAGYGSRGCYSKCYECINKCMSNPRVWGVWE